MKILMTDAQEDAQSKKGAHGLKILLSFIM